MESDAILIAQAKENMNNFSALYEKYVQKLFRYFAVRLSDKKLAEDLTSDTFLRAVEKFDTYEFQGKSFSAWLFQIGHNLLIDYFRKNKKTIVSLQDIPELESRENISKEAHIKLLSLKVNKLLDRFNKEEKEILILKLTADLTFSEIAKIAGKSENTIKSKYFRSLKKLKSDADKLAVMIFILGLYV